MKTFYALFCAIGLLLPYGVFVPWLLDNGLDVALLVAQATETGISAFAWLDVAVSAVVLAVFIWADGIRRGMKHC